jgi:hypothetical protein
VDQDAAYRHRVALLASLPGQAMSELRTAARASAPPPPGASSALLVGPRSVGGTAWGLRPVSSLQPNSSSPGPLPAHPNHHPAPPSTPATHPQAALPKAHAVAGLQLQEGAEPRRGTLLVDVWIWKHAGVGRG